MVNVTTLTFVIGPAAAAAVLQQLRRTRCEWENPRAQSGPLSELIDRQLRDSPLEFDLRSQSLRLVLAEC